MKWSLKSDLKTTMSGSRVLSVAVCSLRTSKSQCHANKQHSQGEHSTVLWPVEKMSICNNLCWCESGEKS